MLCKKCGNIIPDGMDYCDNCSNNKGKDMLKADNRDNTGDIRRNEDKKSHGALIAVIVSLSAVVITLCTVLIFVLVSNGGSNEDKIAAFNEKLSEYEKLDASYSIGVFNDEYNDIKNKAKQLINDEDVDRIDELENEMDTVARDIKESNEKVKEYQELYDTLDGKYTENIIEGENQTKLDNIKNDIKEAIESIDKAKCEEAKRALEEFEAGLADSNASALNDMDQAIQMSDQSVLYSPEITELNNNLAGARALCSEGKYVSAKALYDECNKIIDAAAKASSYSMELKQVDVSDFPDVKLYMSIQNMTTGEALDNLNESMFTLYERIKRSAEYKNMSLTRAVQLDKNAGLNTAIVADCSASMGEDMYVAEDAMRDFVSNLQYEVNDKAALYSFSDTVYRDQHFTKKEASLVKAINKLTMGNMTALYDALVYAISDVVVEDGAKCVIAFTDGMENNSNSSKEYVISKAKQYDIPVYLIGIGSSVDSYDLNDIADATGGFYRNIGSISSMAEVYNEIYARQKSLYVLEYKTQKKNKEKLLRDIYVRYADDNYVVRTEESYTPSDYKIDKFVFYDSDKRYLKEGELGKLSEEEVLIALNEIYARRGYKFGTNPFLIDHFNSCGWYHGTITDMAKVEKSFNKYEKKNMQLLVEYEKKHKLNNRK